MNYGQSFCSDQRNMKSEQPMLIEAVDLLVNLYLTCRTDEEEPLKRSIVFTQQRCLSKSLPLAL